MRFKLKYFLIISLILGAFVTPLAYREYLKRRQQRQEEVKPQVVAVKYVSAKDLAAILKEVFADRMKPQGTSAKTELSIAADERSNTLTISAGPKLLEQIRELIEQVDKNSIPAAVPLRRRPKIIPLDSSRQFRKISSTCLGWPLQAV